MSSTKALKEKLQNEKKHLQQYGKRLQKIGQEHNAYYHTVILPKFEELNARENALHAREALLDEKEKDLEKRESELPKKIEELGHIADAWTKYIAELQAHASSIQKTIRQAPKKLMPPNMKRKI